MADFYLVLDDNRQILTRQINISTSELGTCLKVEKDIFDSTIQNKYNYIDEEGNLSTKDFRTEEEIAEQERLAKLPSEEEKLKSTIELILISMLEEGGII